MSGADQFPLLSAEQVAALRQAGPRIYDDGLESFEVHAGWYELLLDLTKRLEVEIENDLIDQARKALMVLTPREQKVLRVRFGIEKASARDLEHEVNCRCPDCEVIKGRVRQIEAKAMRRLRRYGKVSATVAMQVKTKLGGLRVYLSRYPGKTYELIEAAEQRSMRTCEACGQPGVRVRTPRGWIWTACEAHRPAGTDYPT